jgi:hypothetical protein
MGINTSELPRIAQLALCQMNGIISSEQCPAAQKTEVDSFGHPHRFLFESCTSSVWFQF